MKKIFLIYLISRGFFAWTFLNFLARCARQSHDGYQLLVGDRIYLFYGWNKGSQPPKGEPISRTDMQLDEGFWMRWSDNFGRTFDGGRVVIPVVLQKICIGSQSHTAGQKI